MLRAIPFPGPSEKPLRIERLSCLYSIAFDESLSNKCFDCVLHHIHLIRERGQSVL